MRGRVMRLLVALFVFLVNSNLLSAAEVFVATGNGTLQAAIDAAWDGDTLILQDGNYSGTTTVHRSLIIRAQNRANKPIISQSMTIDGPGKSITLQGLRFSSSITLNNSAELNIIENEWIAGGISVSAFNYKEDDGPLTIIGNIFNDGDIGHQYAKINTSGTFIGGNTLLNGSILSKSDVWIIGNRIISGDSPPPYTAIHTDGCSSTIIGNKITCNFSHAGTAYRNCVDLHGPTYFANNIVEVFDKDDVMYQNERESGLYVETGSAVILNNIFNGDQISDTYDTPIIQIDSTSLNFASNVVMQWNSLLDNQVQVNSTDITFENNICYDLRGGCFPAGDDTLLDPKFIDEVDYVLMPTSPGINGGPLDPEMSDLDLTRNDIGVYGGPWNIEQYSRQRSFSDYPYFLYPRAVTNLITNGKFVSVNVIGGARLQNHINGNEIVRAEAFVNNDPGEGLGTPLDILTSDLIANPLKRLSGNLELAGYKKGLYSYYVRIQDKTGHWSPTMQFNFYIPNDVVIESVKSNILLMIIPVITTSPQVRR